MQSPSNSVFPTVALALAFNKYKYMDLTNQLNNYNEIYNMNKNASDVNQSEVQRLQSFDESLKSKVMKLKQEYLLKDHDIHSLNFWINVTVFSMIFGCLALLLIAFHTKGVRGGTAMFSNKAAVAIICVLAAFYLAGLLLALATKVRRRNYAYDQFYWKPMS